MEYIPRSSQFANRVGSFIKGAPRQVSQAASSYLGKGLPFLRRFAGSLRGVNPVKTNAIVNSAFLPFDIAGKFNEGEHPIRAVGRPLVQLGGGLGGGTVGGLLGFPTTGPGGFATTVAGAAAGHQGSGALFDQAFPKGQVNQRLGDYGRNFSKGANFLLNEYLLGLPTGSSTKPSTGMANSPADIIAFTEDTGRTAAEAEQILGGGLETVIDGPTAQEQWLAETANSRAANAGFDPEVRWQLHQQNKDFQEAKRNRTLDEFAAKYPNSQTAKKMNQK